MEKCYDNKEDNTESILAFDMLYTTNHLKILKLLLPYLETEHQKTLAIFIKWQELMFTLRFFKQYSASLYSPDFRQKKQLDLNTLLPLLIPYCSESEKKLLSSFSQMQNMMHVMEDMQQYMPMFEQLMSSMSGENSTNEMFQSGNNSMMEMLKNMMSEEQQAMFSMFMNET